ncbi:hypothetical protein DdX_20315 [Ditylenchus destructor]|uniref:Uncharacterized protein n=1 Tax=Ditylenchus destructor TaxID=166010 RepID=A0AAD4MHE3_9BILA|nr:hypothetical protein DdX_20315 [Ditylenchus destructor]
MTLSAAAFSNGLPHMVETVQKRYLDSEATVEALGSGRVICQSLPLGERSRLVPVSPTKIATTGRYGFRKSGKSRIWGAPCGEAAVCPVKSLLNKNAKQQF